MRIARTLIIWFHQAFGKQSTNFKPGPFIAPEDPSKQLRDLSVQIDQLKASLLDANQQAEDNQQLIDLIDRKKAEYAVLAGQMDAEARTFEQLALENEQEFNK